MIGQLQSGYRLRMSAMVKSRSHQFKVHKCLIALALTLSVLPFIPPVTRNVHAEAVTGTVAVGVNPDGIAVDNATNNIYVSNYGNNGTFPSTVSVINGASNTLNATIRVGVNPTGIGVNSLNNRIYVANYNSSNVSVIDGTTNTVLKVILVGRSPQGVGVATSTNEIHLADSLDNAVSVIDGHTNTLIKTITVGNDPGDIAVNAMTNKIYVVNGNSSTSTVSVIDASTNTLATTIPVGAYSTGIGANVITNKIYVANSGLRTVSVISGHLTMTSLTCTPSSLPVNGVTTCNAVATDIFGSGATTPTGAVFFSSNGTGSFSTNTCNLSGNGATAACSVSYSPTALGNGFQNIFSTYGGDSKHMSSSGNTILTVTTSTVGGTEIPIDKLALIAPYLPPTLTLLGGMVAIILYGKRRSDREEENSSDSHSTT